MAIYYLDVDDEITSAAARIRDSSDNRIALVLSGGSRVATSRINFRLLAGEAKRRNKRLAIVAADPSVQSVARSAELPVYSTVGEYEKAEAARAGGVVGTAAAGGVTGALDELATTVPRHTPTGRGAAASVVSSGSGRSGRGVFARRFGPGQLPVSVVAGILAVIILVVGIGTFFFYPSATVVLTLREEPVGPLSLEVTVDPNISAPNDQVGTVPGVTKAFPVSTSGTFDATGQNVVDTPAAGTVTFTSVNTVFAVPVLAGTQLSTTGGVAFVTTKTVSVPVADFASHTSGTADAPIQAVQAGTGGNVAAGKIVRLPSDLVAAKVSVTNKSATTGGTHTVTPMVVQADIDGAEKSLMAQLNSSFQTAVGAADAVPAGSNLFSNSARLGVTTFSPDPQGLLNQQNSSFDLGASATGTALVADVGTVSKLAERRIRSSVKTGYALVDGSIATRVGTASSQASFVVLPVTATARQTPIVDVAALRSAVAGMTLEDARTYLTRFGKVSISLSPDWATTMPSFDFRIDLQLAEASPGPSASHSGAPAASKPAATAPPAVGNTPTPAATPAASPSFRSAPSDTTPVVSPSPTPSPSPSPPASATPAPPSASPSTL